MAPATRWLELATTVAAARTVVAIGARTHAEVGGAVVGAFEVSPPSGIVACEPADMTARVNAGTSFAELRAALAEHGQECPLDPRDARATVGGIIATGLSGPRRLALGPLRDHLLEVTFVTADGRVVRGGGPTVKNVTGYDVPRLVVGSLGTLGVLVQVILRTRPLPPWSQWNSTTREPVAVRAALHRASTILWDGSATHVLFEGHAADIEAEADKGFERVDAPALPDGPHRGRISVEPDQIFALAATLSATGVRWAAEVGVGTVHVAADRPAALEAARAASHAVGGWLLRESGAPGLEPFGAPFPGHTVQRRLRQALDPTGKLSPGRVPATQPGPQPDPATVAV